MLEPDEETPGSESTKTTGFLLQALCQTGGFCIRVWAVPPSDFQAIMPRSQHIELRN